jgi:hypothetical protein
LPYDVRTGQLPAGRALLGCRRAFDKLLPDAQDTSNGISLPSALDVHGSYARTVIPGLALGCELLVVVTAAPEG